MLGGLPLAATLLLALSGCWKTELAEIPTGASVVFAPALEAPADWIVSPIELGLTCPDKEPARFYLLYPEAAVGGPPLPAAILYHSGAFDFVFAPIPGDPLAGTHYADPPRLGRPWSVRHVFATLGMLPSEIETEAHSGALPVAFAEQGVPMLLPTNCWGDLWHNRRGLADNDFPADLFPRDGRTAAEWAFQLLADPLFREAFQVELPIEVDPSEVYVVGLGTGGRAVGELLAADTDGDGAPDYRPAGALVDSWGDDLRVYFDDPVLYGNIVAGLDRIFPQGADQTVPGSLFAADLPDRFGYLYATAHPDLPPETHQALLARLQAHPGAWVHTEPTTRPLLLNGDDLPLARSAVQYLLSGAAP